MALVINTNTAALNAQRQIASSSSALQTSMERLASGKRINTAADDAAGLAISNRMTSQVQGLNQAIRNANDGISLIQTAEGALDETTNILQRIRELSIQAANGIYSDADRATLDAEVQQLVEELGRIADTTSFNGQPVLDGSLNNIELQVGSQANQTIDFSIPAMDVASLGMASQSGDIVGAELSLDGNGAIDFDLEPGSIKINGRSLESLKQGSELSDLLNAINDVGGVSASTLVSLEAESAGNGVLSGGDEVTLTLTGYDGQEQTLSFTNTQSLEELAQKISDTRLVDASVNDQGRLELSSTGHARIAIEDDTGGVATGVDITTIADPEVAALLDGLQDYWISEAETLISNALGIIGTGVDLTLNLYEGEIGSTLASVSASFPVTTNPSDNGVNLSLNIDMLDFDSSTLPDGGSAPFYFDRVIAHEMVHAVMDTFYNVPLLPGWFTEGVPELVHGADERVVGDFSKIDTSLEIQNYFKTDPGSPSTSAGYSVSYLAAKMLQDELSGNGATIVGDQGGMVALFNELEGGATLGDAINTVSGGTWANVAAFESYFLTEAADYLNGTGSWAANGTLDLGNADTGSLVGSDYSNPPLDAEDILPNTASAAPINFNLVIPDEYSGTERAANARLILTSENGDDITIVRGANGDYGDLRELGLSEIQAPGIMLGDELTESQQQVAWQRGDVLINGTDVGVVSSDSGLRGKVDAINALTDETGVHASVLAQESFELADDSVVEYQVNAPFSISATGVLGLNGIGFEVQAGMGAVEVSAAINALSDYHGVTAYADDAGNLHMQAKRPIVIGASVPSIQADFAATFDTGAAGTGSLKLNGTEVALSDLTDAQTIVSDLNAATSSTGVWAAIDSNGHLQLSSSSAITVGLGLTNGLKTLHDLGIRVSVDSLEAVDLQDTDGDLLLNDETFVIGPRIRLNSEDDQTIALDLTATGSRGLGLLSVNADVELLLGGGLEGLSVATADRAQKAIDSVDAALEQINTTRSDLGAVTNRLEFTVSNLMNISENTAAARSRIVDADFAAETANLSRAQVLQQASQAMLAQANSIPQQVLQLLRG